MRMLLLFVLAVFAVSARAQELLDEVTLTQPGPVVHITFTCEARFLGHRARPDAPLLIVQLQPGRNCGALVSQQIADLAGAGFAPARDMLARIDLIPGTAKVQLVFEFHEPAEFVITQGADLDTLAIAIRQDPTSVQAKPIAAVAPIPEPGEVAAQMRAAKNAMLEGRYDDARAVYLALAAGPGDSAPEALEYLGVSYEKEGRTRQAALHYEQYLQRFDDTAGAARVGQRLAALEAQRSAQIAAPQSTTRRFTIAGDVSQDYSRISSSVENLPIDAPLFEDTSLFTYAHLQSGYQGDRWILGTHLAVGQETQLDTLGARPRDDATLVSAAYAEIHDLQSPWRLKVGRQTQYDDGVLGRFDGVRAGYAWRPNLEINLTTGAPVDTPRHAADTSRPFVGLSVHLADPVPGMTLSVYGQAQREDSVSARQALGATLRWRGARGFVQALLDYDASYEVLNNALLEGHLRLGERLTLYTRLQTFAWPFINTRNALIGQDVAVLEQLLDRYTEGQLRTLARHRTSDAWRATVGMSAPLGARWNVKAETRFTDIVGSATSGGVAARPASLQFYTSVDFTGSSIFFERDTWLTGVRIDSSDERDIATWVVDARLPLPWRLRANPRLSLSQRDAVDGERERYAHASLRLVKLIGRRYELSVEAGKRWAHRDIAEVLLLSPLFPEETERMVEDFFTFRWQARF